MGSCLWCHSCSSPDDDDQQLDHQRILQMYYKFLGDNMATNYGLVATLFSQHVLNMREKTEIESEPADYKKNELLLNMMYKRPQTDFNLFLNALTDSGQGHLKEVLTGEKGYLPVHINLDNVPNSSEIKLFEREISEIITSQLHRENGDGEATPDDLHQLLDDLIKELKRNKARILKAVPDRSVLLHVECSNSRKVIGLKESFNSGNLKLCVDRIYKRYYLQTCRERMRSIPSIRTRVNDEDANICRASMERFKLSNSSSKRLSARVLWQLLFPERRARPF